MRPVYLRFFNKSIKIQKIPLGIIIPFITSVLSTGQLYFASTLMNELESIKKHRIGRSHAYLTEFETTKIRLAGPISIIILAILLKLINIHSLEPLILVSSFIAITNMIPLPNLDGFHILLTSRPIYVFSIVFILTTALLLNFISPILTLIISLLIATLGVIYFFYKFEAHTKV